MSVELDPVELGFRRPFTHEVSETLRLKNPNADPIAFKVKTTAPKQYCVRPNSGRIEAGQYVEVQVLLQAMKEDPPLEHKCRDKFLVQTVPVPANQEFANASTVWSNIEGTSKSAVQEKKIRVTFLPANSFGTAGAVSTPTRQSTVSTTTNGEAPPAYDSPMSAAAVTPAQNKSTAIISGPVSRPESRPDDAMNLGEIKETTGNPAQSTTSQITGAAQGASAAVASAAGATAGYVSSAIPKSGDDLQAQLDEAKATISRLQQQASEGLRQRKPETTEASRSPAASAMGVQQAHPSGVPVQIVAALCLLSFLLAYLFF